MRIKSKKPEQVDVNMTPMIDIVFQLIAFFMVISNFEQTQANERVVLPQDMLAIPPEVKIEHKLVINIGFIRHRDKNNSPVVPDQGPVIFHGSDFCSISGALSPAEVRLYNKQGNLMSQHAIVPFEYRLDQEKRLFYERGQVPYDDVTVVIRADAEVPTGMVQKLIQEAQKPFTDHTGTQQRGFQTFALTAKQAENAPSN